MCDAFHCCRSINPLKNKATGGGVIQATASEATLVAVLSARQKIRQRIEMQIRERQEKLAQEKQERQQQQNEAKDTGSNNGGDDDAASTAEEEEEEQHPKKGVVESVLSKIVVYTSEQAHSSVKKAAMIAGIPLTQFR